MKEVENTSPTYFILHYKRPKKGESATAAKLHPIVSLPYKDACAACEAARELIENEGNHLDVVKVVKDVYKFQLQLTETQFLVD